MTKDDKKTTTTKQQMPTQTTACMQELIKRYLLFFINKVEDILSADTGQRQGFMVLVGS